MGNASENCVEQSADGGNCEEQWQSHAEKPTGTHAVLFLVDFLDLLFVYRWGIPSGGGVDNERTGRCL